LQLEPVATQPRVGGDASQPGRQSRSAHEPAWQVTPHAHDVPHDRAPLQVLVPLQATVHGPGPQLMSSLHDPAPLHVRLKRPEPPVIDLQLWRPVHATVHDVAPPQITPSAQELGPEHSTVQFMPEGQATGVLQLSVSAQSIVQLFCEKSHDVHAVGQTEVGRASTAPPGTTQNPSTQSRPSLHSCSALHAKSLLRWLTEQPAASAIAIDATSFTATLRT
jgi:hypothetical protein